MKISVRLLLFFLAVAALPLVLFSYLNLRQVEETLRTEALGRMSDLADKKAVQVRSYLAERVQDVRLLVRGPRVMSAMEVLPGEYVPARRAGAAYATEDAKTRQYFERYVEETGLFYDVFFISEQGEVVYTQKHEADFGSNLLTGSLRETKLAQAFRAARMTMEPVISGYENYEPSHAPALFVAAPVIVGGKFKGVFAVQLGNELLYRVANDATGLGATGEVTFAQRDGDGVLYTTPMKYRADAAMKYRVQGTGTELKSLPTARAISGNSGSGAMPDYRGTEVVAAWRYLPGLEWGMVVKVDADEVLEPLARQRTLLIEALAGCLLLAGLTAYYLGRRISRPITALAQVADQVSAGGLDSRADESAPGELGAFSVAFNRMTGNLQELYRTLEERIDERTRELNVTNEMLQDEVNERMQSEVTLANSNNELLLFKRFMDKSSSVMVMAALDGQLMYGNRAFSDLLGIPEDEISRHHFNEFYSPEQRHRLADEVLPAVMHEGNWKGEIGLTNRYGIHRDTVNEVFMVRNSAGTPYAVAHVITDITERKQAEALLQRYKVVLDTALDGYWVTDMQGNLLEANAAYARMSGYTIDELTKMHISQLDALDEPEAVRARVVKIIAEGSGRFETRHRRRDGVELDIEVSVTYQPDVQKMFVFCRDITERKTAQLAAQHQRNLLDEAQRLGQLGSWELDLVKGALYWSAEIYRIFELDPADFQPSYENFLKAIHPEDRDKVNQAYSQSLIDKQSYDVEHRLLMPDGRIKWVHEHCTSDFDEAGKPLRSVGAVQDVTEHKRAEDQLRIAAATFETHEAIMITDADANILRVNQAFEATTGYSVEDVLGKNPRILNSGHQDKAFYAVMWQQLNTAGTWSGEMWDRRKDGQIYPKWLTITAVKNGQGTITEYVAIFSDITERKEAEQEIRNLAFYDALTKLPNRRLLMDRCHQALAASVRSQTFGALLFLDMDRFKVLNDTLGHDYGDLMLIEVADRITGCVRDVDTVARLGGDEFVVLLEEAGHSLDDASRRTAVVAEKIRASLALPYQLKDSVHHSSPSIGVSLYHGEDESVDTLLKQADMAMYQAKDSGRNAVRFFDPNMQLAVETRASLETDLRHAIANQELHLYYQIQVDREFRPLGVEALVRWKHPARGMVSPGQFIPIAEESSLILDIGHWVLDTACRQLASWGNYRITRELTVAVNVSAAQFRQPDFVDQIATLLRDHQVDASRLKLELTESVVMADVADVVAKMQALKTLGVKLSMDDFGTGYSSLSYLKRLPLDQVKIDQSFVRDIATDSNDAMMVRTIIDLAQNFGLDVVAEGVETEEQRLFLKQHGCPGYQGYLFSKPVPVAEFEKLLGGL